MITYEVKYKKIGSFFWKKLKDVKGDGFVEEEFNPQGITKLNKDLRFFIFDDETRLEVPTKDIIFKFSKERLFSIKERMENNTGTDIKINER